MTVHRMMVSDYFSKKVLCGANMAEVISKTRWRGVTCKACLRFRRKAK